MIEKDRDLAIAKDHVQEIGIVKEKEGLDQGNITEKDLDLETVIIISMEINMIEEDQDHVQEIVIANEIKETIRVIENTEGIKNRRKKMNLILKKYIETFMMKIFDIHIAISMSYMYDFLHIFFYL